jgi:hypothetical protein
MEPSGGWRILDVAEAPRGAQPSGKLLKQTDSKVVVPREKNIWCLAVRKDQTLMESFQVQAEGIAVSISSAAVVFPLPVEIQGQLYMQVQLHRLSLRDLEARLAFPGKVVICWACTFGCDAGVARRYSHRPCPAI